jgi:hypothetical protein
LFGRSPADLIAERLAPLLLRFRGIISFLYVS